MVEIKIDHSEKDLKTIVRKLNKKIIEANKQLKIYKKRKKKTYELAPWKAQNLIERYNYSSIDLPVFPKSRNDLCAISIQHRYVDPKEHYIYVFQTYMSSIYLIWKKEDNEVYHKRVLHRNFRSGSGIENILETEKEIIIKTYHMGEVRVNKEELDLE